MIPGCHMAVGIDTMACILWLYVVLTVLLPCVGEGGYAFGFRQG